MNRAQTVQITLYFRFIVFVIVVCCRCLCYVFDSRCIHRLIDFSHPFNIFLLTKCFNSTIKYASLHSYTLYINAWIFVGVLFCFWNILVTPLHLHKRKFVDSVRKSTLICQQTSNRAIFEIKSKAKLQRFTIYGGNSIFFGEIIQFKKRFLERRIDFCEHSSNCIDWTEGI